MPVDKPLAEWAYTTPKYPTGLLTSDLSDESRQEQSAIATHWFLVNFQPLGGGWFTLDVSYLDSAESFLAPDSWSASQLLHEEFDGLLAPDLIDEVAERFSIQSNAWRAIPSLTASIRADVSDASLDETTSEIRTRLDRIEILLARQDQARHEAAANVSVSIVTAQIRAEITTAISEAREGISAYKTQQAEKSDKTRSAFWNIIGDLGKGATIEAGKLGADWLANHGLWLWQEIVSLYPVLQHWCQLARHL